MDFFWENFMIFLHFTCELASIKVLPLKPDHIFLLVKVRANFDQSVTMEAWPQASQLLLIYIYIYIYINK